MRKKRKREKWERARSMHPSTTTSRYVCLVFASSIYSLLPCVLSPYLSPFMKINNEINDNRPENCFGFCSATILLSRGTFFSFAFPFLFGLDWGKTWLRGDHPARNLLVIYCVSVLHSRKGRLSRSVPFWPRNWRRYLFRSAYLFLFFLFIRIAHG